DLQIPTQGPVPPSRNGAEAPRDSETVMPQLSESFIERLIQMTANSADTEYRQRLTKEYHEQSLLVVPLQEAVAYDMAILELVRTAGGGDGITREMVAGQLASTRTEIRDLTVKVHEIYRAVSRNLNPSTQLVTLMPTPASRIERSLSLKKIVLYGLLTCLVALPLIIIFCLIHNRIREEDAEEGYAAEAAAVSR
ncbi:MAG TPA: hypothetical protein VHL59_06040, partial [Thermoanaerobaculia bacterium]|nr:hypothetical protein [Thermoanaerobaculia bacterium]